MTRQDMHPDPSPSPEAAWRGGHQMFANFSDEPALVNNLALTAAYGAPRPSDATEAPPGWDRDALSTLARQLSDYENQIAQLKASREALIAQREQWKAAAHQAEAQAVSGAGRHYATLKHRLAMLLHPDTAPGGAAEKAVRQALFAEFWSAVEQIEHVAATAQAMR